MTGKGDAALNLWTVGAIAIVAYCLTNVLHEGLGHGGACLLAGGRPETFNAIFFSYDETGVSALGQRWIAAAGSIVNLLSGGMALAWGRWRRPRTASCRYFLWLFSAVNLLMTFGYLLFSGVGGIGDWAKVVEGLGPPLLLRLGLALAGAALYFVAAPRLLMPEFWSMLGSGKDLEGQVRRLSLVPYLTGGTTFLLASAFNPYGLELVLISGAAASFGGTSLLAWYPATRLRSRSSTGTEHPLVLGMSRGWMVAAGITLIVFVGVLGPGVYF